MAGKDSSYWKKEIEENRYFLLDPIQYESHREIEKIKLVNASIEYTFSLNEKYREYGTEVWELILRCIEAFDEKKGTDYLIYYKAALWKEGTRWDAKAFYDEKAPGMHISKEKLSKVKKLIRQAESRNHSTTDRDFSKYVAKILQMTEKDALMYINIADGAVQSEYSVNDEGEECRVADMMADDTPNAEELIVQEDGFDEDCAVMQEVFECLQERQKKLLSMMITSRMYDLISDGHDISRYGFFDRETFDLCDKYGRSLTAREISAIMELNEASVSRSWKNFEAKLKIRREK